MGDNNMLIVQKYGGSSVADAEKIRRVAGVIADARRAGHDLVVVLSARGDTTDELLADALELNESPPPRELDALLSTGELGSVALMAMQLERMGISAVSMSGRQAGIRTDANHGQARIKNIQTRRIMRELDAGRTVLVAGFQGINENDDVTTLGRGGSDTTAVALAAALCADRCEIYSDVDGIYTADPRLVTGAKKLERISRRDMLLLARGGSQVLHSRAVEAAIANDIDILCLSSYKSCPGTLVTGEMTGREPYIAGITRDKALDRISIVGVGAGPELLAEAVAVLCENGVTVLSGACAEGEVTVTSASADVLPAMQILHRHFIG